MISLDVNADELNDIIDYFRKKVEKCKETIDIDKRVNESVHTTNPAYTKWIHDDLDQAEASLEYFIERANA
jgi:hypothetical protein